MIKKKLPRYQLLEGNFTQVLKDINNSSAIQ